MRRKIALLTAALLACVLLFASCAAKSEIGTPMEEPAAGSYLSYMDGESLDEAGLQRSASDAPPSGIAAPGDSTPAAAGRKLIKNITADIETLDFDAYLQAVEAKTAALGGHVHSKQTGDYGYNQSAEPNRRASLVLRIPAQSLDAFKQSLGDLGKVTKLDESVRDETMTYNDTAAHIEALQVERDAMLGLMSNAKNLADLLALQERVTDIRRQLNSLEGQLRLLDDQVALSTVTLTIIEVGKLTPAPEPEPEGYLARTWDGFKNSVSNVVHGVGDFVSGLIIALPYLVALGIPVALAILLFLRRRKKRKQANKG